MQDSNTVLHYGMLSLVAVNLVLNILTLQNVENNRLTAARVEAVIKQISKSQYTKEHAMSDLAVRDAQIRELQMALTNPRKETAPGSPGQID
jgi:hypothetical protein